VISGLALPVIRVLSWWHRETRDIGVRVADATDDLATIRAVARRELPGCTVRRGLYYRYLLSWPGEPCGDDPAASRGGVPLS
jgi:hypothetical protein